MAFSFLQTPEQIYKKKIKSFSHGEYNDDKLNKDLIEKKILQNEDIFDRGFKLINKIDDSFSKLYI